MNVAPATSLLSALSSMLAPKPVGPPVGPGAEGAQQVQNRSSAPAQTATFDPGFGPEGERAAAQTQIRFDPDAPVPTDRPPRRGMLVNILA